MIAPTAIQTVVRAQPQSPAVTVEQNHVLGRVHRPHVQKQMHL